MTRIVEGSMTTPERTPSQSAVKMVPCPTHTVGHPAIVVTQLASPMSPISYGPTRHQNQLDHTHATRPPSGRRTGFGEELVGGTGDSQAMPSQFGPRRRLLDETFELKLWRLVPTAFRPRLEGYKADTLNINPEESMQGRPNASDIIDRTTILQTTPPRINRTRSLIQPEMGTVPSPATTESPGSPFRKRRHSNPSILENNKRRYSAALAQSSPCPMVLQPMPLSRTYCRERNPFEVDESEQSNDHPVHDFLHRSQQVPRATWRLEPVIPPALRYRRISMDPDISPDHSPTRVNGSPSRNLHIRRLGHEWRQMEREGGPTAQRTMVPKFPLEALLRTDDGQDLRNACNTSRPSSPDSTTQKYLDVVPESPLKVKGCDTSPRSSSGLFRTPVKPIERRLSMSSLSPRSPTSASSVTRQFLLRRPSLTEHDSPHMRTPTRPVQRARPYNTTSDGNMNVETSSSLADSPTGGIQWSQSLETPVRNGAGADATNKTPANNVIQRLRGLQPAGLTEDSPQLLDGWSASLETPPRKDVVGNRRKPSVEPKIKEEILERLRGLPHCSLPRSARVQNVSSQDGPFYSTSSSVISEDDGYQYEPRDDGGRSASGAGTPSESVAVARKDSVSTVELDVKQEPVSASLDIRSLDDPSSVGATLPSSLLHELEEDSSVIGDAEYHSQILTDSQEDMFDAISNSAINKELLSKSNDSLQRLSQLGKLSEMVVDSQSLRFSGNIAGLSEVHPTVGMAVEVENTDHDYVIHQDRYGALAKDKTLGNDTISVSQDLNLENMHLEAWTPSPIVQSQDFMDIDVKQDDSGHPGSRWRAGTVEINSDDGFGNIRLSQLDDGFNVVPNATSRTRKKNSFTIIKEEQLKPGPHNAAWISTSASMLGDMDLQDERDDAAHIERRHALTSSFMTGGFSTAAGKHLAPISKAALARVANLFEDQDEPSAISGSGFNSGHEGPNAHGITPAPVSFSGFKTAGNKALPPTSKAAQARATLLFQDDNVNVDMAAESMPCPNSRSRAPQQQQQFGGFTSGTGKKLAPVSNEAMDKWSKQFAEDNIAESDPRALSLQLGGFAPGSRKALAPTSKAVQEGVQNVLDLDESASVAPVSAARMIPFHPQHSGLQGKGFGGFLSGTGKSLAPISKAAQERAMGVLELDEPVMVVPATRKSQFKPEPENNRVQMSGPSGLRPLNLAALNVHSTTPHFPPQPVISSHMNNLKLKSQRASSGSSSLSTYMKPKTSFKPPVPFKSPMRILDGTAANVSSGEGSSNVVVGKDVQGTMVANHLNSSKRQVGRRTTLHPNARPNGISAGGPSTLSTHNSAKITQALSYTSLFNLEAANPRPSLQLALSPPRQRSIEELLDLAVPKDAINMTLSMAQVYRFPSWGIEEAYNELLSRGATEHLLPKAWLSNHYGLVIWKLACYVRTWPEQFFTGLSWFTPEKTMDQLAYRYEREINRAERPALRRIVEGDDTAARHMVLCIASITEEYSEEAKHDIMRVLVTDGWYTIPAVLDACLTRAVERGKLKVGSKIHVCRSKLNGAESGVAILELAGAGASSISVSLSLQANSTRLAPWHSKLGFQREPLVWTTRLRSVSAEGGMVPGLDVVVLRKYPVVYLETLEDGVTKIKRNAREEDLAANVHREKMERRYQNLVQDVEKELGSEADMNPIRVQEEVQERAAELQTQVAARNVVQFFTIRVGDYVGSMGREDNYGDQGGAKHQEALVTFWHADHEAYQEGHRVRVTSLIAKKPSREFGFEDMIQLTGTRMSTVHAMTTDPEAMLLTNYHPREVTLCADIEHLYHGAEVDMAVVVLAIGEGMVNFNKVFMVVTDASKQLVLVEHQLSAPFSSVSLAKSNEPMSAATGEKGMSVSDQILPPFMKVQSKILLANARYKMRDHKLGLNIVSSLQSYAQVTAAPPLASVGSTVPVTGSGAHARVAGWPPYAQSALQQLNQMCSSSNSSGNSSSSSGGGGATLLELMAKANAVLESMQPQV
ncbi:Breast cancer 2, early onset [Mortierella claussenii]|nr:Breast cancer 2, early onset [Mortierella claussenii]